MDYMTLKAVSYTHLIQYAKERVERLTRDQVAVICRDSNPVTTVYELVEFLNSKRT